MTSPIITNNPTFRSCHVYNISGYAAGNAMHSIVHGVPFQNPIEQCYLPQ